ncbi:MAG: flagellar hook capping protein [Phenylobacterium zucineum]|nr:MAG: flagellar hook capping protein [Phenylobacterium zucineum]
MTTTTAATTNTSTASTAQDTGALGKARLASSFDTFLTLLTSQLKNQDPLSPLDSNQFTQQLVQMTGVEQQIFSNDLLKQLVSNSGSTVSQAVSVIGKDVEASTATSGLAGGKASWNYKLDRTASDVKLEILDAAGKIVHAEAASDNAAGSHALNWNGKDLTGRQLADGGAYTLRVTAVDAANATVASAISIKGRVTAVEQSNGAILLSVGGAKIPFSSITTVTEAATTPTGT